MDDMSDKESEMKMGKKKGKKKGKKFTFIDLFCRLWRIDGVFFVVGL